MLENLRRIVTGHDQTGKSVVVHDGPLSSKIEQAGHGLGEIWQWQQIPHKIDSNFIDPTSGPIVLEPPASGAKVRYFLVPPEPDPMTDETRAMQDKMTGMAFDLVQAGHCRVDTARHPAMHKTDTTDIIVLLRGSVTLRLDKGDVELNPGDCVVQQGTNHAWVNYGDEPALLLAVLVSGKVPE